MSLKGLKLLRSRVFWYKKDSLLIKVMSCTIIQCWRKTEEQLHKGWRAEMLWMLCDESEAPVVLPPSPRLSLPESPLQAATQWVTTILIPEHFPTILLLSHLPFLSLLPLIKPLCGSAGPPPQLHSHIERARPSHHLTIQHTHLWHYLALSHKKTKLFSFMTNFCYIAAW